MGTSLSLYDGVPLLHQRHGRESERAIEKQKRAVKIELNRRRAVGARMQKRNRNTDAKRRMDRKGQKSLIHSATKHPPRRHPVPCEGACVLTYADRATEFRSRLRPDGRPAGGSFACGERSK